MEGIHVYLTIRPVARKVYGSIAHETKPNGLLTRGLEGEGSNCFSITQLVGQKGNNKVSKCKLKKIFIWEKKNREKPANFATQ